MSANESSRARQMRHAYFEEADQHDNPIAGTKVAASVHPGSPREGSHMARARNPAHSSSESSDGCSDASSNESASAAQQHIQHDSNLSRRMSSRDHQARSPTQKHEEHPSKFRPGPDGPRGLRRSMQGGDGLSWNGFYNAPSDPMMVPITPRTRVGPGADPMYRHSSYQSHTETRPPLANMRFSTHHPIPNHHHYQHPHHHHHHRHHQAQPPMVGSFPPPMFTPAQTPPQQWVMPPRMPPVHQPMASHPPMGDYFTPTPRSLESRFGSMAISNRPNSAIGQHPSRYEDGRYDQENRSSDSGLHRRSSSKARRREDQARMEDRIRMPPPSGPPRPHSTAPRHMFSVPSRPPSRGAAVRAQNDHPFACRVPSPSEPDMYNSSLEQFKSMRPSASRGRPVSYDNGAYVTEVARTRDDGGHRRGSFYASTTSGSNLSDRMAAVSAYQNAAEGGPPAALTAEALREADVKLRGLPSAHSTRSSASREESDTLPKSAVTRTTRYSDDTEDIKVRFLGGTTVKVQGAEFQSNEGVEISIPRGIDTVIPGGGSDRSSHIDPSDDRRLAKPSRPPPSHRNRASSQADSYSRTMYDGHSGHDRSTTASSSYQGRRTLPSPMDPSRSLYGGAYQQHRDYSYGS